MVENLLNILRAEITNSQNNLIGGENVMTCYLSIGLFGAAELGVKL